LVISNSSPLVYLAALGDFELLRKLFVEIAIPPAVFDEVVVRGSGFPVADMFSLPRANGFTFENPLIFPRLQRSVRVAYTQERAKLFLWQKNSTPKPC
jgi:hypothetical protein